MTLTPSDPASGAFTDAQKIDVLFEEYKALYGLAQFRLTSLDRRAMLAWAALGAFLSGFGAMSDDSQRVFLMGIPLAIFWLLRTTINHARSFEDALRRLTPHCGLIPSRPDCVLSGLAGHLWLKCFV